MAEFTGKATGNWNTAGQLVWNEVGTPGASDNETTNAFTISLTQNEAITNNTVSASGGLSLSTYNLVGSGTTTVNGTLTMGTSSDTGLTTAGFAIGSTGTFDGQQGSIINNSGNISIDASATFTNEYRGKFIQTASANGVNPSRYPYEFTINAGVTLTQTGVFSYGWTGSNKIEINGTAAMAGNTANMGVDSTGSMLLGASSDITGGGSLYWAVDKDATFTDSGGTKTFSGTVYVYRYSNAGIPFSDWSNANIYVAYGGNVDFYYRGTTLKCKNFTINAAATRTYNIYNDNNLNSEISGNVDIDASDGTVNYNASTSATMKLTGNSANFNARGKTIEKLEVNCTAGQTKTNQSAFTCASYTGTTGTFADGGYAVGVNGSIELAVVANLLNSTGHWTQLSSGNLAGDNNTNVFQELTVAGSGIVTTMTDGVYCNKLNIGQGTLTGSQYMRVIFDANNALTIDSSATVTISGFTLSAGGAHRTLHAVSCAGCTADIFLAFAGQKLTLTGTMNLPGSDFGYLQGELDLDTFDMTCGDIKMGYTGVAGILRCGDGTIDCNKILAYGATATCDIYGEDATIQADENVNLTYITWHKSAELLKLDGGNILNLTFAGQSIYNLEIDKSANDVLVNDNGTINSLIGTQGTIRSDSAGVQRTLTATVATAVTNMTIQDISMGSANKVNAKAATNTSGGNNLGIVFQDSFGEM